MKPRPMPLAQLMPPRSALAPDLRGVIIKDIACDSRLVKKGALFAAFKGARADGLSHVKEAVKKGAHALLLPQSAEDSLKAPPRPAVFHKNPRACFAHIAGRFYPEQPDINVAVTGTNGKTSVALFTQHLFRAHDPSAASLGTLGLRVRHHAFPSKLTTPSAEKLQKTLSLLARRGAKHAVLEASSHGLDQHRLDGVKLAAAAFTHIGRDHLDYHKSQKDYLRAKMRILNLLPQGKPIVLYDRAKGAAEFAKAAQSKKTPVFSLSHKKGDLVIKSIAPLAHKTRVKLLYKNKNYEADLPFKSRFQTLNALLAASLALAASPKARRRPQEIFHQLQTLPIIPGRAEYMGQSAAGGHVYVDYAHTPDALEALLKDARAAFLDKKQRGKLHLLFGCGGERDQKKRPEMGALAQSLADEVIITDDNPRGENASKIRQMIRSACPKAREIAPRGKAIARAIASLEAGDVLLIAGKGHEETQTRGYQVARFSDREEARTALIKNGGWASLSEGEGGS